MTPARRSMLLEFQIINYKGIVRLAATPNGRSLTLTGANGAGKSSAIEALYWALGGEAEGDPLRLGADEMGVTMRWNDTGGELFITRTKKRGKKPALTVRDVERPGAPKRAAYASPTALLERFRQAIGRNAFSQLPEKERVNLVRRIAPGLDVSDLEAERGRVYAERTQIGREAEELAAQAIGVVVPEVLADVGPERDLAIIAGRKVEIERARGQNEIQRAAARRLAREATAASKVAMSANDLVEVARNSLRDFEAQAEQRERERITAQLAADEAATEADMLVDPDPSDVDSEIAAARAHNQRVRAVEQRRAERARAEAERAKLAERAAARSRAYGDANAEIKAIDEERTARIAGARCPIPGLALTADGVVYPGRNGPVPVPQLSTGERIALDVAIAAALELRVIPVPGWADLDREHRARIDAQAEKRGVQLLRELTTPDGPLEAVIEEGTPSDADDFQ